MAVVTQSKRFHLAVLGLLGACVLVLAGAQILRPANTVSKAPKSIIALPKEKDPKKASLEQALKGDQKRAGGKLTVSALNKTFSKIGYELDPVLDGKSAVPRLFLSSLPYDLGRMKEADERKSLFFRTLLPLVLRVNEEIKENRAKVWRLRHRLSVGLDIRAEDRIWLDAAFDKYKVKSARFDRLLEKMDVVPPSLALAQAAEESGWGTSRFTREGNALFGQWTHNPKDKGIVPQNREEGKTHRIKAFDSLSGSLKAYVLNLNTHKAYRGFRALRKQMHEKGEVLRGYELVTTLDKYSERGEEYVTSLQAIIKNNDLMRFDKATLDDDDIKHLNNPLI
ncbi:MAG: glucosaminidase domain-containing protein [Methylocystaceae bacterium]|nr:glucosaminidase domain-containing protein [Methylocystaceae bacterium]